MLPGITINLAHDKTVCGLYLYSMNKSIGATDMHMLSRTASNITIGIVATLFLVAAFQAQAFCINNHTQTRLYFMVEPSATGNNQTITFERWIEPGQSKCCDWNNQSCNPSMKKDSRMSFYAFDAEDALEGCDRFGTADSNINLKQFIRFDRCHWGE